MTTTANKYVGGRQKVELRELLPESTNFLCEETGGVVKDEGTRI